jgi:hypothetical protein
MYEHIIFVRKFIYAYLCTCSNYIYKYLFIFIHMQDIKKNQKVEKYEIKVQNSNPYTNTGCSTTDISGVGDRVLSIILQKMNDSADRLQSSNDVSSSCQLSELLRSLAEAAHSVKRLK